jgi:hypothetical protein
MALGLKTGFVLTALGLLLFANFVMLMYNPYGAEGFQMKRAGFTNMGATEPKKEGFTSYYLQNGAGAKDQYQSIGPYDNVALPTGNAVSQWRYTAPNEPLQGPAFTPGPDQLFMFKSNQCKPECCGASFSCSGGCVCTTPEQRQLLASRGGNRTQPEDSA